MMTCPGACVLEPLAWHATTAAAYCHATVLPLLSQLGLLAETYELSLIYRQLQQADTAANMRA